MENSVSIKIFCINNKLIGNIEIPRNVVNSEIWESKISTKRKKMFLASIKQEIKKLVKKSISCLWVYRKNQETVIEVFVLNEHKRIVLAYIGYVKQIT